MASTNTVANTLGWIQAYCMGRTLTVFTNNEPAITCANLILSTIIAPPFRWNWNRSSVNFLTSANVQDYSVSASTFGWIENASYIPAATVTQVAGSGTTATITANNAFNVGDLVTITGLTNTQFNVTNVPIVTATSTQFTFASVSSLSPTADSGTAIAGKASQITNVVNILGAEQGTAGGSPNSISPLIDNNAGNITFRILPVPDGVYQVTVIFQKKIPALISSTSTTWAPIPDQYAYIYEWGFLALLAAYSNDVRWTSFNQKFVTAILGACEGLDEEQKNVFQTAWLNSITEQQATTIKSQQGIQSRGI